MAKLPSLNLSKPGTLKKLDLAKVNKDSYDSSGAKPSLPALKPTSAKKSEKPAEQPAHTPPALPPVKPAEQSAHTPPALPPVKTPSSVSSSKVPPIPGADKTCVSDALATSISDVVLPTVPPPADNIVLSEKTSVSDAVMTQDNPVILSPEALPTDDSAEPDKKTVVADIQSVLKSAAQSGLNEERIEPAMAQVFSSEIAANAAQQDAAVRIPKADSTITYSTEKLVADMKATSDAEARARNNTNDNSAPRDEEKYEVKVSHYADYGKENNQNVYSDGTKENIRYASKTPGGRFFSDFINVILRPTHFWESQNAHPATIAEVFLPHLLTLIIVRAIAFFVGGMLKAESDLTHVLVQTITQVAMIFVFIFAFAFCVTTITAFVGKSLNFNRAFKFASYAITPILLTGILSVIPVAYVATICDLVAMPWAFCVLGCGVVPYLHLPEKSAPAITGIFCGIMMCLWGGLPILLPYLIQ